MATKFAMLIGSMVAWAFASDTLPQIPVPGLSDGYLSPKTGEFSTVFDEQMDFVVNQGVLQGLRMGELLEVDIPVLGRDVRFKATRITQRQHSCTWKGETEHGEHSLLLTTAKGHFFAVAFFEGQKVFFESYRDPARATCYTAMDQVRRSSEDFKHLPDDVAQTMRPVPAVSEPLMLRQQDCGLGEEIDVMILYTQGLKTFRGDGMDARMQFLIDVANESYENSGIQTRLNLAHAQAVDYPDYSPDSNNPDEDDITVALNDLTQVTWHGNYDMSVFQDVEDWRDQYGCDQVTLLRKFDNRSFSGGYFICGLAWTMDRESRDFARYAYAVVPDTPPCTDETAYAHEVGHNMGCNHDKFNGGDDGAKAFPYSLGWQDPSSAFVTVMGYDFNGYCPCGYVHHFSNPQVTINGRPTGSADESDPADNARTINNTRDTFDGFRKRLLGTFLDYIYVVPEVFVGQDQATSLYVVNPGGSTAGIEVFGFSSDGSVKASKTMNLPGGNASHIDLKTVFGQSMSQLLGWVQLGSTQPLDVLVELKAPGVRSAYWASTGTRAAAFLPHVAKNTAQFETMIAAVNAGPDVMQAEISPEPFGDEQNLGIDCPYSQATTNALDFFGGDIEIVDWAELQANLTTMSAMEYFSYLPDREKVASLGLNDTKGDTLRFLHVAADVGQFWTGLVYMNVGSSSLQVTETYFGADGAVLESRELGLIRGEKRTLLFDVDHVEPLGTVWVEVRAETPDLVGYELFGAANQSQHDYFAGLQGSFDAGQTLRYARVESTVDAWTGIVALNVGVQHSDITFEAMGSSGQLLEAYTEPNVGPYVKVVKTVASMFSESVRGQTAWIRARASASSWAGFELWGDLADPRQNLAGVTAVAE